MFIRRSVWFEIRWAIFNTQQLYKRYQDSENLALVKCKVPRHSTYHSLWRPSLLNRLMRSAGQPPGQSKIYSYTIESMDKHDLSVRPPQPRAYAMSDYAITITIYYHRHENWRFACIPRPDCHSSSKVLRFTSIRYPTRLSLLIEDNKPLSKGAICHASLSY